jgi:isopentenyldiphosphate isomerase
MSAPIQIVDEHDKPLRAATKQEAWEQGLWHRVVRVMCEDGQGNVLLQHRSATKDIYPNCWDNSAAGHVDAGEDYETAVHREIAEELGISDLTLQEIGRYTDEHIWKGLQMKCFVRVYKATIAGLPQTTEPDKIDDLRWFTIADVKKLVADHPDQVTDGLQQVVERYYT